MIKRLIYFLCCIICAYICLYMGYKLWAAIDARQYTAHTLIWGFATLGWIHISYNVIMRNYRWSSYLCK